MPKQTVQQPNHTQDLALTADLTEAVARAVRQDGMVERCQFKNDTLRGDAMPKGRLEFTDCVFERCVFECRETRPLSFVDVTFINCDLSNIRFHKSGFLRVKLQDCKALGSVFSDAILSNVTVKQSVLRYAAFSASKLTNVLFSGSDFSNCALEHCTLKSVQLEDLNLTSAEVSFTPLKGIDLTTCVIAGMAANPLDLRGAIIESGQAVDLVGMLGVVIRDGLPRKANRD